MLAVIVAEQPVNPVNQDKLDYDVIARDLALAADVTIASLVEHTERRGLLAQRDEWNYVAAADHVLRLITELRGRRLLLVGRRVVDVFADQLQMPALRKPGISCRVGAIEVVHLPQNDPAATGPIVRAEVDRYRKVRGAWTAIRLPFGEDIVYHPATGQFAGPKDGLDITQPWSLTAERVHAPWFAGLDGGQRAGLLEYLVDAAGRVCRWGSGVPCYVGPHSIDVAGRTAQLAQARGWDKARTGCAITLAAMHDLHECLPLHGDVPGPVVRMLGATSPAFTRIERLAREAILEVCALTVGLDMRAGGSPEWTECVDLVHLADLDCRATERALFFRDAPAWLGPRGQALARAAMRAAAGWSCRHLPPEVVYTYQPQVLQTALHGVAPDFCPSATLLPVDP